MPSQSRTRSPSILNTRTNIECIRPGLMSILRVARSSLSCFGPARTQRTLPSHQTLFSIIRPLSNSRPRIQRYEPPPIEDPNFISLVDQPRDIVKGRRRHGPGLVILGTAISRRSPSLHTLIANSSCSPDSVRPRHLASPAVRMEDRSHRQI